MKKDPWAAIVASVAVTEKRNDDITTKRRVRATRRAAAQKSHNMALPKPTKVGVNATYKNPVTLSPVKGTVYQLTNRETGRKNYYNLTTLSKLIGKKVSNYQLLMANPKTPLFRNPMTRGAVYPRDLVRVKV